jgi:hypothetical protein
MANSADHLQPLARCHTHRAAYRLMQRLHFREFLERLAQWLDAKAGGICRQIKPKPIAPGLKLRHASIARRRGPDEAGRSGND